MAAELYTEQDRCRQASLHCETVAALPRRRSTGRERLDEPQRNWGAEIPRAVTKPVWTGGLERLPGPALQVHRRSRATKGMI